MSESEDLETLVYCLGQVGGPNNPVMSSGSAFNTKYEYTTKGYERFMLEGNNVIKLMNHVIKYFLESVKSEFEEDPLAFIDLESEEDSLASIQKMKKQWSDMFKEHQKELRDALKNKTLKESTSTTTPSSEESANVPKPTDEDTSEESSSSSSAKMPRLDPKATPEAKRKKASERKPESTTEAESATLTEGGTLIEGYSYTYTAGYSESYTEDFYLRGTYSESRTYSSDGVPVECVVFPESVFIRRIKDFGGVLKKEYQDLRSRVGKVWGQVTYIHTAHDLKGFTLQRMEKFAKWKYAIKALDLLIQELKSDLGELDLDFHKRKENEKRLTDWLSFDDGKRDRKYHHRILIPMDLTGSFEEISAVVWKQLRRYMKMKESLKETLPEEHAAFLEKEDEWKYEVLYHRPMKKLVGTRTTNQSDDTNMGVEDLPLDS